ncbi:FtsK/SpoIIIE domain-containing protein [Promicromonospora sp. NPDC057138]|uniref:FtsK/SpoIIIE domain-containing protein n=1 Tax=Promicromonospora sp. NPDC057138 TaxID=3346031 RepID=UPI0036342553
MTRPRASDCAVRVTLHPGEDVLLRPGARLADVRAPLAALTRRPELRYAALAVDRERLTDERVVGERPLLPGAELRVAPMGRAGVPRDAPLPGPGPWSDAGKPWLVARAAGPDAGTVVGAEGLWAALRAWVRLRPDGRLAIRRTGGPATWLAPRPEPAPSGVPWALTLLPAIASLGLAAALRQPLLAVFALVGLVVTLPQLRAARQRAAAGPGVRNRPRELPGPAGLLAFAHAALHVSPGAWAAAQDAWTAAATTTAARATARAPGPFGVLPGPGAHLLSAPHDDPWEPLLHDGAVAVLGPDGPARAVARALVARLAARGAEVLVGEHAPGWSWARWLPAGGPRVLVLDGAACGVLDRAAGLRAAGAPGPTGPPDVDLMVSVGTVPPGCRAVARVLDARRVRITGPDGAARTVPLVGVTAEWAEHLARLLAGAASLGRTAAAGQPEDSRLPDVVPLTRAHGLAQVPGPEALAARWADARGWAVPLGIGADGTPVCLDLVRDGPHLLVAGTTGSGKSELLQTLLLGLALTRSPADLALVLVDFKGGASLGACPALPHVVGQVTDLEPGLAARALGGLRAELRRRERVLAAHAVPDVTALPRGTLPRLVVVIDEFRALADDLPEFLPALLRVAAQGRSLGVHLVLATQRPGGAVGPDLRANVSARLALRVTDPLESRDVLDDPAAARIPAGTPGRAVLRLGSAPPVLLQCAHATAPREAEMPLVRRAPARAGRPVPVLPTTTPGTSTPDAATLLVDAARGAARAMGHAPGAPPWLPALPRRATVADLPPATRRDRSGLALAVGDDPDHQRRTTVTWDPADGHLAILGRARSGRTTALVAVALSALERGWAVHGIARDAAALAPLRHHPGYGGTVHPDDAEAMARVLSDACPDPGSSSDKSANTGSDADRAPRDRALVLVDGAEDVRGTLPAAALRSGPAFALSADGPSVGGLASRVGPRLVLLGTDRAADVVLGAPVLLAGSGGPPGRAAWCGRGDPVLCQVLEPDDAQVEPGISPRSRSPRSPPRRRAS